MEDFTGKKEERDAVKEKGKNIAKGIFRNMLSAETWVERRYKWDEKIQRETVNKLNDLKDVLDFNFKGSLNDSFSSRLNNNRKGSFNRTKIEETIFRLKEYFAVWCDFMESREKYIKADIILRAYYPKGKIRDYLENIKMFPTKRAEEESAEKIAFQFYNNYVYYLKFDMEELKKEYEEVTEKDGAAEKKNRTAKMKKAAWFLKNECCETKNIEDIYRLLEEVKLFLEEQEGKEFLTEAEKEDYVKIMERYKDCMMGLEKVNVEAVLAEKKALADRNRRMQSETEKADMLYKALTELLTEEWFAALNPDREEMTGEHISGECLAENYLAAKKEIEEKILNKF